MQVSSLQQEIARLKEALEAEKVLTQQGEEYEALLTEINKLPSRSETAK
jgi:hypothetical protein